MQRGQVSLEFVMVLSAALSFIAVSFALYSELESLSLFSLDVQNAKSFVNALENQTALLQIAGDGSSKTIRARVLGEWFFSSENGKKVLAINTRGKSAAMNLPLNAQGFPRSVFHNNIELRLVKRGTKILVESPNTG